MTRTISYDPTKEKRLLIEKHDGKTANINADQTLLLEFSLSLRQTETLNIKFRNGNSFSEGTHSRS